MPGMSLTVPAIFMMGLAFHVVTFAVIASDTVAVWVGVVVIISGGVATVVKNWKEMAREQLIKDQSNRIKFLDECRDESEMIRKLEIERHQESEKTFRMIEAKLNQEIENLRNLLKCDGDESECPLKRK